MLHSENPYASPESLLAEDELGALLFERRASRTAVGVALLSAVCSTAVSVFFARELFGDGHSEDAAILAMEFGMIGPGLFVLSLHLAFHVTRFHENGIAARGLIRNSIICYEHLEGFTFLESGRNSARIVYTLTYRAKVGSGTRRIHFNYASSTRDEAIIAMRDRVSGMVANRMARELQIVGAVRWTSVLRFVGENLECTTSRGKTSIMPIDDFSRYSIRQYKCYLYRKGHPVPFTEERTVAENFYPGLTLLTRLAGSETNTVGR